MACFDQDTEWTLLDATFCSDYNKSPNCSFIGDPSDHFRDGYSPAVKNPRAMKPLIDDNNNIFSPVPNDYYKVPYSRTQIPPRSCPRPLFQIVDDLYVPSPVVNSKNSPMIHNTFSPIQKEMYEAPYSQKRPTLHSSPHISAVEDNPVQSRELEIGSSHRVFRRRSLVQSPIPVIISRGLLDSSPQLVKKTKLFGHPKSFSFDEESFFEDVEIKNLSDEDSGFESGVSDSSSPSPTCRPDFITAYSSQLGSNKRMPLKRALNGSSQITQPKLLSKKERCLLMKPAVTCPVPQPNPACAKIPHSAKLNEIHPPPCAMQNSGTVIKLSVKRKLDASCPPSKPLAKRKCVGGPQNRSDSEQVSLLDLALDSNKVWQYTFRATQLQKDLDHLLTSIRRVFLCSVPLLNRAAIELERDTIVKEMKETSEYYSRDNLVNTDYRQDFSVWQVRWGYMFMYLMRHAHMIFDSLKQLHLFAGPETRLDWKFPFDSERLYSTTFIQKCSQPGRILKVCAIGGGPGSDLIGLALFLRANRFTVKISAYILDICGYWAQSWYDLQSQLPPFLAQYFDSVQYVPFDYLSTELTPFQEKIIASADLVTIVKSISPVATKLLNFEPTVAYNSQRLVKRHMLYDILSTVSPSTLVLYIDNKCGNQGKVMKETVQSVPGYILVHHDIKQLQLVARGFSPLSRCFMKWVGYGPSFSCGMNEIIVVARRWMFDY